MSRAWTAGLGVVGVMGLAATVVAFRRQWIVVTVVGGSMLPSLREGDVVLARRRHPRHARVGDVVIFEPPGVDDARWMIKRVAAVSGDTFPRRVPGEGRVPASSLVVLGDNGGLDSRMFGPLPFRRVRAIMTRPLAAVGVAPGSGREFALEDWSASNHARGFGVGATPSSEAAENPGGARAEVPSAITDLQPAPAVAGPAMSPDQPFARRYLFQHLPGPRISLRRWSRRRGSAEESEPDRRSQRPVPGNVLPAPLTRPR